MDIRQFMKRKSISDSVKTFQAKDWEVRLNYHSLLKTTQT